MAFDFAGRNIGEVCAEQPPDDWGTDGPNQALDEHEVKRDRKDYLWRNHQGFSGVSVDATGSMILDQSR